MLLRVREGISTKIEHDETWLPRTKRHQWRPRFISGPSGYPMPLGRASGPAGVSSQQNQQRWLAKRVGCGFPWWNESNGRQNQSVYGWRGDQGGAMTVLVKPRQASGSGSGQA